MNSKKDLCALSVHLSGPQGGSKVATRGSKIPASGSKIAKIVRRVFEIVTRGSKIARGAQNS